MNNNKQYGTIAYYQEEEKKAEMTFHMLADAMRRRAAEHIPYLEKAVANSGTAEEYEGAVNMCDDDLVLACKSLLDAKSALDMYTNKVKELKDGESV